MVQIISAAVLTALAMLLVAAVTIWGPQDRATGAVTQILGLVGTVVPLLIGMRKLAGRVDKLEDR